MTSISPAQSILWDASTRSQTGSEEAAVKDYISYWCSLRGLLILCSYVTADNMPGATPPTLDPTTPTVTQTNEAQTYIVWSLSIL